MEDVIVLISGYYRDIYWGIDLAKSEIDMRGKHYFPTNFPGFYISRVRTQSTVNKLHDKKPTKHDLVM